MISVEQLADIISRSPKGTALKPISRQPGRERYRGLCPFHQERTPSFDVFVGFDGAGHYCCHGCHKSGSAEWWLRSIEGKKIAQPRPNPELQRERERQKRRASVIKEFRDRNPDSTIPDWLLMVDI